MEQRKAEDRLEATLRFIGRIRTPYRTLSDCPRNVDPDGPACTLQIDSAFAAGLRGLDAGQDIWVLYWLYDADRDALVRQRRQSGEESGPERGTERDTERDGERGTERDGERGVFALRSPHRPNPIGAAALKIKAIRGTSVEVQGLDCLDGTPLLDIRPAMFAEQDGEGRWAVVG